MTKIADKILKKIKEQNIDMRPKYYFIIRAILLVVATLFVLGVAMYLMSLIMFIVSDGGGLMQQMGGYVPKPRGAFEIMRSLPWLLVLLAVVLLGLLELLGSKFEFVYSRPLVYSFVGFVVIVMAGGALLLHTPMHKKAFELSNENRLPLVGPMYRHYDKNMKFNQDVSSVKPNNNSVRVRF